MVAYLEDEGYTTLETDDTALDAAWVKHRSGNDGTVWVVITRDDQRRITDVEILDQPPLWDLAALGQVAFVGNVNGGDSVPFTRGPQEALS
jgi:hypothetical protein